MTSIDLTNPPRNHNYAFSVEREETPGERRVRLFKDVALFVVALIFVAVMSVLCIFTVTSSTATPDDKKWATSLLSAATAGIVGYLVKK